MAGIDIDFTKLSFDEIKEELKESLREDGIITDYSYEGSNTDTLLNIMSYVTTMINHNLNYMGSESFLSTARNRKNILKHAQALNYKVERKVSAKLNTTLNFVLASKKQLKIPKHTIFYTDDETTFITTEDYTFINNQEKAFPYSEKIILKEGEIIDHTIDPSLNFIYDKFKHANILLRYKNIENYGITLTATDTDNNSLIYTETTDLLSDIQLGKNVFISDYDPETEYVRLKMLNKYSISPDEGSDIKIEVLISKGARGNNYKKLLPIVLNDSHLNPNISASEEVIIRAEVTTQDLSYSGADEESDEEIRQYAPLAQSASNRVITALDWEATLANLPQVSSPSVWGGDEIGIDLVLTDFESYQKEALKKPGYVFMTGANSSGHDYFSLNLIESIKETMRNNSIVALRKVFIQPVFVGFDLNFFIEMEKSSKYDSDVIEDSIIEISNRFFEIPFKLHYKQSKLINEVYAVDGVDSVNMDLTKINIGISGVNFYDDTQEYLDVTLPISGVNLPLNLNKISSSEQEKYLFRLEDIPDGYGTSSPFDYNNTIDTFLDHTGVQPMNYFIWEIDRTYQSGDIIMYPDRETGLIYRAKVSDVIGDIERPSDTQIQNPGDGTWTYDNNWWEHLPTSSKYMDKLGRPIDFSNYKRVVLSHNDGTRFKAPDLTDNTEFYNELDLVWEYNGDESKIIYYISKSSNNTSQTLTDTDKWEQLGISASLVAEGDIVIGTYMKEENMLRLANATPRKTPINDSDISALIYDDELNDYSTEGLIKRFNKSQIIKYYGTYYISRFPVEVSKWATVSYNTGDIVTNNSVEYYSFVDSNESEPSNIDWLVGTTYNNGETTYYNNASWESLVDSNIGNTPTEDANWTRKWNLIPAWSELVTYNTGDLAINDTEVWECLIDAVEDIEPLGDNRYWKRKVKNIDPASDVTRDLWNPYSNTTKFNRDIFSSNIHDLGTEASEVNIVGTKRMFYFDDIAGTENVNINNLRFKKELLCKINTRVINIQ